MGGKDVDGARDALAAGLADVGTEPVTLTSPVGEVAVQPSDLGVSVDIDTTVGGLVGFSSPRPTCGETSSVVARERCRHGRRGRVHHGGGGARSDLDSGERRGVDLRRRGQGCPEGTDDGHRDRRRQARWPPCSAGGRPRAPSRLPPAAWSRRSPRRSWPGRSRVRRRGVSGPVTVKAGRSPSPLTPKAFALPSSWQPMTRAPSPPRQTPRSCPRS